MVSSASFGIALALLSASPVALCDFSIDDYGAVAMPTATNEAAAANALALTKALLAANASTDGGSGSSRTAVVPAGKSYWMFQSTVADLSNVTLSIAGEIVMSNNISAWPTEGKHNPAGDPLAGLLFKSCRGLTLTGGGTVQGLGYDWWWSNILHGTHRPHMLMVDRSSDVVIHDLSFIDSPMYHLLIRDVLRSHIYNVSVMVHMEKQKHLLKGAGRWHPEFDIPVFPLNTDGIDPSGKDFLIEDCFIRNYDDAVAVKPNNGRDWASDCSENMVVRNMRVEAGVGMSIGSVPPDPDVNCIRNITFSDITFRESFKSIYIKPNPGDNGTGLIEGITYNNISGDGNLWYPIWLGTQQQDQPSGGTNTDCQFLFPIEKHCPTNPRITVRDVTLRDITFTNSEWLPGVFLCNATNPCTGVVMDNVVSTGPFHVQKDYYCANVDITSSGSTAPVPKCANDPYAGAGSPGEAPLVRVRSRNIMD